MTVVSLSQAEIDDVYHLAYFECEAAAIDAVRRIILWDEDKETLDLLINRICAALHEVEVRHMGDERYAALMNRLISRKADHSEVPS